MSSKSQQKLFLCIQCSFRTTSSTQLDQHVITHSGQGVDKEEDEEGVGMEGEEVGDGVIDRQFRCWHSLCPYVGRSGHGLRVHLMRSHDLRVKTNACLETKEEESQEGVVDSTCSEEKKDWKCSETNCPFVGKSWVALRSHGINGHKKDKTGVKDETKRRRKRHVMSYRRGHQRWTQLSRRQMELKRRGSKGSSGPLENTRDRPAGEHKCQFPKCGFRADTSLALREHIRSVHKRPTLSMTSSQLNCYFPKCLFSASDSATLQRHLSVNHSMAATKASPPKSEEHWESMSETVVNGQKSYRIHTKNTNHRTVGRQRAPTTTAHSVAVFACADCNQTETNLFALRQHIESAH